MSHDPGLQAPGRWWTRAPEPHVWPMRQAASSYGTQIRVKRRKVLRTAVGFSSTEI
jgi:hypothetical protein